MAEDPGAQARLAEYMNARRVDLGMRWADVAAAGGISAETLRAVRRDLAPLRDLTKAGIERGLQWQRGSVDRIIAGGKPSARDDEPLSDLTPAQKRKVYELIQEMRADGAERRGA